MEREGKNGMSKTRRKKQETSDGCKTREAHLCVVTAVLKKLLFKKKKKNEDERTVRRRRRRGDEGSQRGGGYLQLSDPFLVTGQVD